MILLFQLPLWYRVTYPCGRINCSIPLSLSLVLCNLADCQWALSLGVNPSFDSVFPARAYNVGFGEVLDYLPLWISYHLHQSFRWLLYPIMFGVFLIQVLQGGGGGGVTSTSLGFGLGGAVVSLGAFVG